MATTSDLILKALLLLSVASTAAMARPLSAKSSLLTRLKLEGEGDEVSECWDSLFQLQSCTGEVILFFMNGEAYLGPSCCRAIRIVGHKCWPAVFGSLGFTAEESDVLRGYCDAEDDGAGDADARPPHPANLTPTRTGFSVQESSP
ncbi:PREDICTED: egg cell-secreted protein 1.1-like [Ipomoea nil]|uniref:egg cell-secreted protein 1.1-like n=1 Tax=Ipomoea nil TaxID=35883 RepID=UPI000901AA12|nr:PREDICTED: egg cell-secreted protein 1.1-like [Ipomoea nil]